MKTLILVRHAKSSWHHPDLRDFDRPLNARGLRNAPMMGARLQTARVRPQRLMTSPAVRAQSTAEILAEELGLPSTAIQREERLYAASVETWLEVIEQLVPAEDTVLLVGHNPAISELVAYFGCSAVGNVPTCGVVKLDFAVNDWTDVVSAKPTGGWFDYPKNDPETGPLTLSIG